MSYWQEIVGGGGTFPWRTCTLCMTYCIFAFDFDGNKCSLVNVIVEIVWNSLLQFGFNMFPHDIPRNFSVEYKCYSVSMMPGQERHDVEQGGKSMLLSIMFLMFIKLLSILHKWTFQRK